MLPLDVIDTVRRELKGEPVFLAGSLVAAHEHGLTGYHDVDLFTPTSNVLMTVGQKLLDSGYKFDDRFDRVWHRWRKYGMKGWHTNSLRLISPLGIETNLVYKLADGHPTTSLAQVLESFDFGLLGVGYDLEEDQRRDLRPYLFPNHSINGPLPMMPGKRDAWRNGFISEYNGIREMGRYAKYHEYGYDLSLVKDDLIEGYRMASLYLTNHFDDSKKLRGQIYTTIADHIDMDNIDHLITAAKEIDYSDELDAIYEKLE